MTISLSADLRYGADFWSSQVRTAIDIQVSLDGGVSFQSLIQGYADTISIDMRNHLATIVGRDYASLLIDTSVNGTFANQTASEVAGYFAHRHGLMPYVTPTQTLVGRFYESDYELAAIPHFSHAPSEWDLLAFLGQQEGYEAFVNGTGLYFQPPSAKQDPMVTLTPSMLDELQLEREMALCGGAQVIVRSWNSFNQTAYTERAGNATAGIVSLDAGSTAPSRLYDIIRPNLSPDQASNLAQRHLKELTRQERAIDFRMPGELLLAPRAVMALAGTGTAFDQAYYIDYIERAFRPSDGFVQRVRASNSSAVGQGAGV